MKVRSSIAIFSLALFTITNLSLSDLQINKSIADKESKTIKTLSKGYIDWSSKVITVKGNGAEPETGGKAQKRLKARLAARNDAYRNLAEILSGVNVTAETTVKNFVTESDVIRLKVEAVIKGARQTGEEVSRADGTIELEMSMPLFGSGSIASALDLGNYIKNKSNIQVLIPYQTASIGDFVVPEKSKKKSLPESFYQTANKALDNVTGLIIEAGDLGVEPAMNPFVVGGGKVVYAAGRVDIDPENIVKYGVTDYAESLEAAKNNIQRVGASPMIIEAKGATGSPSRTNILLDEVTLKSLMDADKKDSFLSKLNVIIVI